MSARAPGSSRLYWDWRALFKDTDVGVGKFQLLGGWRPNSQGFSSHASFSHSLAVGFPQWSRKRESTWDMEATHFHNPTREVLYHHPCHILLVRSESIWPAHHEGRDYTRVWISGGRSHWEPPKSPPTTVSFIWTISFLAKWGSAPSFAWYLLC